MMNIHPAVETLVIRFPELATAAEQIDEAAAHIITSYEAGGKLLVCGNGGSCADSEHIVGELLKGFNKKRPLPYSLREKITAVNPSLADVGERLQMGLPAVALTSQNAILTAVANDLGADLIYAQQVLGLGRAGDVFIGISTSGNADNVYKAAAVAKALGLYTLALTGRGGGRLAGLCDLVLRAPADATPTVQEYHLCMYHVLCDVVEQHFFPV